MSGDKKRELRQKIWHVVNGEVVPIEFYVTEDSKIDQNGTVVDETYPLGKVVREEIYQNGELHNGDNPAVEVWDLDKHFLLEEYLYVKGKLQDSSSGTAAVRIWSPVNTNRHQLLRAEHWSEGLLHNSHRAAVTDYDPVTGEVVNKEYYMHGQQLLPKETSPVNDRLDLD